MKTIMVLLFFAGSFNTVEPDIVKIREMCQKAPSDEDVNEDLVELLEPYDENNPLLFGYKGIATMIMAKHVFNPFKRMSYFKKGKSMLESAIEADPSNVELRYLRFSAQTEAPGFLNYNENIAEDKVFLIKSLPKVREEWLKNKVRTFLLEADSTTEQEKTKIKDL